MISKKNERVQITLSKKQAKWLKDNAKKLDITVSRFIKFLIDKNLGKFLQMLPDEKLEWMIKIAKTPWLDFDTDDDDPFNI